MTLSVLCCAIIPLERLLAVRTVSVHSIIYRWALDLGPIRPQPSRPASYYETASTKNTSQIQLLPNASQPTSTAVIRHICAKRAPVQSELGSGSTHRL